MSDKHYIHGHAGAQKVHAARTAADSTAFLLPHLTKDTVVVDVGCGPGSITLDLARRIEELGGQASQVTGIDVAEEAIGVAHKAAQEANLDVTFTQGEAISLPLPDNCADVVFMAQVLHHLPDPVAALKECARVVKPGGIIASREVDYGAMLWYPPSPGLSRWRAIFSVVADLAGMQPNAGRHLPLWFHRASLTDVSVSSSNWTYGDPERRAELASSWAERTQEESYVIKAAEALGDLQEGPDEQLVAGEATRGAITQIVEGWHAWADTPGALFVMPHVEVIARVS